MTVLIEHRLLAEAVKRAEAAGKRSPFSLADLQEELRLAQGEQDAAREAKRDAGLREAGLIG